MIKFIPTTVEEIEIKIKERNETQYEEMSERQFIPDLGRSPIKKAFPDHIIQKAYCF